MPLNETDNDLISRFLEGELSETDDMLFHEKMRDSPEFSHQVKLQKTVIAAWSANDKSALKDELREMYFQSREELQPARLNRRWLMAAAAVVLIAALSVAFYLLSRETKAEILFAQNFELLPAIHKQDSSLNELNTGLAFYENENFSNAVPVFEKYTQQHPNDAGVFIYLGVAQLALGNSEAAIETLKSANPPDTGSYKELVFWYTAMAHLARNEPHKARKLLTKVNTLNEVYAEKAGLLLEKLN